jgi:hypothetical protein
LLDFSSFCLLGFGESSHNCLHLHKREMASLSYCRVVPESQEIYWARSSVKMGLLCLSTKMFLCQRVAPSFKQGRDGRESTGGLRVSTSQPPTTTQPGSFAVSWPPELWQASCIRTEGKS